MSLIGEFRARFPAVTSQEPIFTAVLRRCGQLRRSRVGRLVEIKPDAAADPRTDPLDELRPSTRFRVAHPRFDPQLLRLPGGVEYPLAVIDRKVLVPVAVDDEQRCWRD